MYGSSDSLILRAKKNRILSVVQTKWSRSGMLSADINNAAVSVCFEATWE